MALTDQEIWDMDYKYIPQQKWLLNSFEPGGGTQPGDGIPNTYNYGIPNAYNYGSVNTGDGNDGQTGLEQTWLSLPGDPKNYRRDQLLGNADYFPPETKFQGIMEGAKNFFFPGKVRGTLGDRLYSQYQTGQKLPSWIAGFAGAQSPFNPESKNYNKNFVDQLNYLEGLDNYIGRDEGSNLLKYGPDSVLSGQNVISGFGSNDYEEQLQKKLDWYSQRAKVGKRFSDKKRQDAIDEMKAWNNSPDNPKNKPTDGDKTLDDGNEPPVGGHPGSGEEWGNLSDPNNPLYEPPSNDYGFDNSGNFTGEGPGPEPDQGETSADSGHASDPMDSGLDDVMVAQGGRVGLNLGGLASILSREGFAPGGPAGGASAGGDYGGNVNPEQEYAGRTFEETYGGEVPPTVVKDNFTVDTNLLTASPSVEINYTPSQWAQIMARLSNEDVTSTDDINFEGQFTGGNNLIDYGIDFTDEGVTGGNVGLNYGDLNLQATTDLNRHNLGVNYNKGPFFVSGNIDNMGNKNVMGGVKWSFGEPDQAPVRSLSYKEENPDLIYGQNLRHGGLARLL